MLPGSRARRRSVVSAWAMHVPSYPLGKVSAGNVSLLSCDGRADPAHPRHGSRAARAVLLLLVLAAVFTGQTQDSRPGVSFGRILNDLPVPVSGYQVYLFGEMHGIRESEELFAQYLEKLNTESGLRDVAIEEDAVYEPGAQAYVEGRLDTVPGPICLRAGILDVIRKLNAGRRQSDLIRVHLVDIDTPAAAIRQHLLSIRQKIPAASAVKVPRASRIARSGLKTVEALERLTSDSSILAELRTVRHSIRVNQQGLVVGTRGFKGSPYLEDREQAIAENIQDLTRLDRSRGVLAYYGSDHVSKSMRRDGGANRDRPFAPMALRLEQAGLKVYSLMTFPLTGRWAWRGRSQEMLWTPDEGRLESGETLDKVANAAGAGALIYIDRTKQGVILPSTDLTNYRTEAVLLFSGAQPLPDRCSGLN